MSRVVWGDGPAPCDLMLVGERPGWEEARAGVGFVGRAGDELWSRFDRCGAPSRQYWYVTNLVKTFSKDPPAPAEILKWAKALRQELADVRPRLVVTVGAHAMRWFLPHSGQESHHGLLFRSPRTEAVVLPIVHSSAALRQPERYQKVFTEDCRAVAIAAAIARVSRITLQHEATPPQVKIGQCCRREMGCDTEGTPQAPECVTFYDGASHDLLRRHETVVLGRYLARQPRLIFHNAVNDLRVLQALGADTSALAFDDTMLMAYLLGEFMQGLKPLAFRQGLRLQDYADLLQPIDDARVRQILENWYAVHEKHAEEKSKKTASNNARPAVAQRRRRVPSDDAKARDRDRQPLLPLDSAIPRRAITSVRQILTKDADATIRRRWQNSKFYDCCPLPPAPTWHTLYAADPDAAIAYACGDAEGHYRLKQAFWPRLEKERLIRAYEIDRAVLPFVARMETVGMQVDGDALRQLAAALQTAYTATCAEIHDLLGYELNPKASEDVSHTLFDELGITPTKLTKSGKHYTTQDKYLEARKQEHDLIPLIMRGREEHKLLSSYAIKLPGLLRDGRYYPEFSYTRTASGRLSESIILLIPKHGGHLPTCAVWAAEGAKCSCVPWSKRIRQAFVAGDGRLLVSVDLSQIELRVLAHMSKDAAMIDAYERGDDLHTLLAWEVLGAPKRKEDQDESRHRFPAKKCNFGAFMGLSPAGLTEQIRAGGNRSWAAGCAGCDDPRADHRSDCDSVVFFREYWKARPGVRAYIDRKHAEAARHGFVRDMFGAKIYVHGIWSSGGGIRREAQRKAQATPVQASADRISKLWMTRVWDEVLEPARRKGRRYCEPWCRVHDDTILEVDERIARSVKVTMQQLVPQALCVPVEAEGKMGRSWGALK